MFNLRGNVKPCDLHYELLPLFTQFLDDDDIKAIRETFQHMDQFNSGVVEVEALRQAFKKLNVEICLNKSDMYESPKSSSGPFSFPKFRNSGLNGSGLG